MSFVTSSPYVTPKDWINNSMQEMMRMVDETDPMACTTTHPMRHHNMRVRGRVICMNNIENEGEFIVRCEIPGVPKENINLCIENNMLSIKVTKEDCCKDAACQSDVTWHSREICHGSDSRIVRLPSNLNQDAVKCSYKDGVLCVAFPKVESHGGMKKLLITS